MGTLIRHACTPPPVFTLAVAVIQSSLRTPLVTAVGAPPLTAPSLSPACLTAIALSPVTVPADPEHRFASRAQAHPLTQYNLATKIHRRRQTGLDNGDRSWQVRTSLLCGHLLKVARQNARPLQRPGVQIPPAFEEELYTFEPPNADD